MRPSFRSAEPDSQYSGNRFDDYEGRFGVLYAGSSRLGCFIETLAYYRQRSGLIRQARLEAEIDEILDHEPPEPRQATRVVPASWLSARQMAKVRMARARFADVCDSQGISYLRQELESHLAEILPDKKFDLSDVMSRDRRVSQRASTLVHSLGIAQGIFYQSRFGRDLNNWAIFEPFDMLEIIDQHILTDDSDFREALAILNLSFDPAT